MDNFDAEIVAGNPMCVAWRIRTVAHPRSRFPAGRGRDHRFERPGQVELCEPVRR